MAHDLQTGGMESQIRVLKSYCEQNDIKNAEFFTDEGISGTKSSRPALDRMMAAVDADADTASEFDGFTFWQNFFEGVDPYVKCEKGHYRSVKKFDWGNWVNYAWDESINCNEYDVELEKSVLKNIEKIERNLKRKLTCPIDLNLCADLTIKYIDIYPYVLSPKCINFNNVKKVFDRLPMPNGGSSCF